LSIRWFVDFFVVFASSDFSLRLPWREALSVANLCQETPQPSSRTRPDRQYHCRYSLNNNNNTRIHSSLLLACCACIPSTLRCCSRTRFASLRFLPFDFDTGTRTTTTFHTPAHVFIAKYALLEVVSALRAAHSKINNTHRQARHTGRRVPGTHPHIDHALYPSICRRYKAQSGN